MPDAPSPARWLALALALLPLVPLSSLMTALLERSGARLGLYAGDDTTDLDAFAGLRAAGLEHAVCVAVASEEGPAALREAADAVVEGPEQMAGLLRHL